MTDTGLYSMRHCRYHGLFHHDIETCPKCGRALKPRIVKLLDEPKPNRRIREAA
jgi:NAD-dependent SIR2 family protein deacetylase